MSGFIAGRAMKDVGNTFISDLTGVNPLLKSVSYTTMGNQMMVAIIGILGHKLAAPINRRLPKWFPVRL